MYERHCTIRKYLAMQGVPEDVADRDACEMEHIVSPETYKMMQEFISRT